MIIKTKFDIDQEVWVVYRTSVGCSACGVTHKEPIKGQVIGIQHLSKSKSKQVESYNVRIPKGESPRIPKIFLSRDMFVNEEECKLACNLKD